MLQRTVEEQRLYLYWHRRQKERITPRKLLRESDELVYWLEECLVQNRRLVPSWLLPRLVRLITAAQPQLLSELGRERRPEQVLEVLFRVQEALMQQAVAARAPARVIPLFRDTASDEAEPTAASSG